MRQWVLSFVLVLSSAAAVLASEEQDLRLPRMALSDEAEFVFATKTPPAPEKFFPAFDMELEQQRQVQERAERRWPVAPHLRFEYGWAPGASGIFVTAGVDYELVKRLVVSGYVGHYSYKWENGEDLEFGSESEEEKGSGTGVGVELRFYTGKESYKGFYIGAGVGVFAGTWEFKGDANENGVYEASEVEEDDLAVIEFHVCLGYNWKAGPVAFGPSFILGDFYNSDAEAGAFVGLGIHAILVF